MDDSVPPPVGSPAPNYLPWLFAALGFFLTGVLPVLVWVLRQRVARRRAAQINVAVTPVATESTPPALPSGADDRLTLRERRTEEIRRHLAVHFSKRTCLYCPAAAVKPAPVFRPVRSVLDPLLRRLGVTRMDRWFVDTEPGTDAPHLLCERHFERARGLMERELADVTADGAAFMDRLRLRIHTYEQYELDEQLLNDVQTIKRGRPKRTTRALPETSVVRQLKTASGDKTPP